MSLNLLLDARGAQRVADGITRVSLEMTRALRTARKDWRLSVLAHPSALHHFQGLSVDPVPCAVPRFKPGEDRRLSPLIRRLSPDVYVNYSMAGPTPEGVPTLLTVHDLMVLSVPCYFGNGILRNALFRRVFHRRIRRSLLHASSVGAPSGFTAREIRKRFPQVSDRVFVFGEGQSLFPGGSGSPEGRENGPFLYVGNARAYKNLPRLLTAYGRIWAMNRNVPVLVMVVRRDRAFRDFQVHLASCPARERITVVSEVSDGELRDLYLSCRALLMPSVWEGFGLPALEAMAAGAPVMVSKNTTLEEVTGDTGISVDPYSVIDIARGIALLSAADPGELARMGTEGMARAEGFTWERVAGVYAEAIEALA